ncbi:MAG: TetR/AcrR family transcriptional regulator [Chloroflexota bacterium]
MKPREIRQQKTRQAILDATRKLISEKGVDGLSMRGIAKAIDYSPAGLYEYFGSKEDLLCAVVSEGHQRFSNYMHAVDESLPFKDYMYEMGRAYINFAANNPDYFLLIFTNAPHGDDLDHLMENASSFNVLVSGIQKGIDEGLITLGPKYGIYELAMVFWTSVHGLAMLRLTQLKKAPMDFDHIYNVVYMNQMKGLTS